MFKENLVNSADIVLFAVRLTNLSSGETLKCFHKLEMTTTVVRRNGITLAQERERERESNENKSDLTLGIYRQGPGSCFLNIRATRANIAGDITGPPFQAWLIYLQPMSFTLLDSLCLTLTSCCSELQSHKSRVHPPRRNGTQSESIVVIPAPPTTTK